jgi:hypothetical protein
VRLLPVAAAVLALALVSGCSSDDDHHSAGAHGSHGSHGSHDEGLPSEGELAAYFDAVASYDPALLAQAQQIAADGSPAQDYAAYLAEFSASAIAAGQPVEPAEATAVDDGWEACGGTGEADECVTWADLEGEDGELTDFTVAGTALDDSLVDLTDQPPIESPGLYTVQPEHAYRSPQSGTLFVLVAVTAGDVPLAPERGLYIDQDTTLKGIETRAPATVAAGASTPVVLAFPDAGEVSLDGSVTFGLRVGQTEESIGFGLTAPAA